MTVRTWLYGLLTSTPALTALIDDRVFAKKSMQSGVEQHPFIVYKLGNNTSEELSETINASRQFIQVYVHDFADKQTGDYTRIDEVIQALKAALKNQGSAEDGVITTLYLETSQDLDDDTLSTVMKYVRFQLITEET